MCAHNCICDVSERLSLWLTVLRVINNNVSVLQGSGKLIKLYTSIDIVINAFFKNNYNLDIDFLLNIMLNFQNDSLIPICNNNFLHKMLFNFIVTNLWIIFIWFYTISALDVKIYESSSSVQSTSKCIQQ